MNISCNAGLIVKNFLNSRMSGKVESKEWMWWTVRECGLKKSLDIFVMGKMGAFFLTLLEFHCNK